MVIFFAKRYMLQIVQIIPLSNLEIGTTGTRKWYSLFLFVFSEYNDDPAFLYFCFSHDFYTFVFLTVHYIRCCADG